MSYRSAEEKLKELESLIDLITLKAVKTLAKETARGAYYAIIGDLIRERLPQLLSGRKSRAEIEEELIKIIKEAERRPLPKESEEQLRRLLREEISKIIKEHPELASRRTAQPTPTHTTTTPTTVSTQPPQQAQLDIRAREFELRELEKDISHYNELLRKLEEKWALGEMSDEEYMKKRSVIERKLSELKLRRERLLFASTARGV